MPGLTSLDLEQAHFDELAKQLSPVLLRYFRRYVGDCATADDLLQETLLRIEQGLAGFAGRASMETWALAIATRVAADYYRLPEHRVNIVEIDEAAQVPDPDRPILDDVIADEMNACVRRVIDSLPEDYRAALVLHDLEGMTAQQAAEICGCSIATAKIRIHRARARLKDVLQQQCSFYRDEGNIFRCDRKALIIEK